MKKIYIKPHARSLQMLGGRFLIAAVSTDGTQTDHADVKGHNGQFNTDNFWKDDISESNKKMTDKYVF